MKPSEKRVERRTFLSTSAAMGGTIILAPDGVFALGNDLKNGGYGMKRLGDVITPPEKEGREKHVPDIEAPAKAAAGKPFQVTVTVGKETAHPNTVQHHIKWVQIFAKEDGPKPVVHVATFDFGPAYAEPRVGFPLTLNKSSDIIAVGYCNLHGLWDNSVKVEVE